MTPPRMGPVVPNGVQHPESEATPPEDEPRLYDWSWINRRRSSVATLGSRSGRAGRQAA